MRADNKAFAKAVASRGQLFSLCKCPIKQYSFVSNISVETVSNPQTEINRENDIYDKSKLNFE